MRRLFVIAALFGSTALSVSAFAQSGTNISPGQLPSAMNQAMFNANTDAAGFSETSLFPTLAATGTTQVTAAVVPTRTVVITSCPGGAGVALPALSRYAPITVVNRSGASCLVYPTIGATVESVSGTAAAVNVAVTVLTNTNTIFRPVSATAWTQ